MGQSEALDLLEYQLPPTQPLLVKGSMRGQLLRPPSHLLRQSVIYSVPRFVTSLKKLDPHLLGFCQIHCVQYVFPTQKRLG